MSQRWQRARTDLLEAKKAYDEAFKKLGAKFIELNDAAQDLDVDVSLLAEDNFEDQTAWDDLMDACTESNATLDEIANIPEDPPLNAEEDDEE